jgi:hypothetical protein
MDVVCYLISHLVNLAGPRNTGEGYIDLTRDTLSFIIELSVCSKSLNVSGVSNDFIKIPYTQSQFTFMILYTNIYITHDISQCCS